MVLIFAPEAFARFSDGCQFYSAFLTPQTHSLRTADFFTAFAFHFSRASMFSFPIMRPYIPHMAALFLIWIIHSMQLPVLPHETCIHSGIHWGVCLMVWCFRTAVFGVSRFVVISYFHPSLVCFPFIFVSFLSVFSPPLCFTFLLAKMRISAFNIHCWSCLLFLLGGTAVW